MEFRWEKIVPGGIINHFHCELADWARHLGETDLAAEEEAQADRLRDTFNRAFYKGNGVYARGEWTALSAPLYFKGLCAAGEERKVAALLVEKVRAFGT